MKAIKRSILDKELNPLQQNLKEEINEYDRLIHLLNFQKNIIFDHNVDALRQINASIDHEVELIHMMRESRDRCVDALAEQVEVEDTLRLNDLLLYIPKKTHAEFKKLVDQVMSLMGIIEMLGQQKRALVTNSGQFPRKLQDQCRAQTVTTTESPESFIPVQIAYMDNLAVAVG